MAVYFQGMNLDETVALTQAMVDSGDKMKWSNNRTRVDKHSTGGIGDKVSIILAPLLAAMEVDVPMISGRGLGMTGGTLDKLESIKGFRCEMSEDEFRYAVNGTGCAIVSASKNLAVADKKLYALRDVTGTIPSVPLITASILSKKLAAGLDALVLDVKCGSGAFMKTLDEARTLAKSIVAVGNELGTKTTAVISDMNQPLGRMVGNTVEIEESLDVLRGEGPDDVRELTVELAAEVLLVSGRITDTESGKHELKDLLERGKAMQKFESMVKTQDGDLSVKRPVGRVFRVNSMEAGFVNRINSDRIGMAVVEMGGGRQKIGDQIDHSVGIEMLAKIGDEVQVDQVLANVFCDNEQKAELAVELVGAAFGITPVQDEAPALVVERIAS